MYNIQHCFICRPSDSTVSESAEIELRIVTTLTLRARRPNHLARSHLNTVLARTNKIRTSSLYLHSNMS
jgi:hypothetical protein